MRKPPRGILGALLLAAAAAGTAWLLRPRPLPVETGRVTRGPLAETVEEEGKTRVRERFVISSPVAGQLERVDLREGDAIAEGQIVARLEPLPLDERARAQAEARLSAALASERAAGARARQARDALAQAIREHRRADDLARQGLRAPEERELAELAEASRARELEAARQEERAAAYAAQEARAALLAQAGGAPGGIVPIRSPVAGRVLRVIQESERPVPAGTTIVEVGNPADLEIVVDLLSTDAVRVRPGAPMRVEGGEGRALEGRVRQIEPSAFTKISALGVEEQRVNVIGDFVGGTGRLGDGYRVEVEITTWRAEDALRVPAGALFRRGGAWGAFVVERGRARERDVALGHRGRDEAEVLRGLRPGEAVVLHPSDKIADGVRVAPGP